MTKENEIDENFGDGECGCSVNYLLFGIAVIFIVMYIATTIK
ncbi:MAG: hypothetical protein WCE60_09445 [Methanobacterium sp.]